MYLRRNRSGQGDYEYWTLVRSVRTAQGPRQEIVATLGKLPGLDEGVRAGWEDMESLLEGAAPSRQLKLGGTVSAVAPVWQEVNVEGVRVERVREFGVVYLALALWRRLQLHRLLGQLLGAGK